MAALNDTATETDRATWEMAMTEWIDDVHDALNGIMDAAHVISGIAHACERLGLPIAEELRAISRSLKDNEGKIRRAVGHECADGARRSDQATRNMVSAALASLTTTKD